MGNASFDVGYEFVNAAPTVAEYSISMFEPFWMPESGYDLQSISPDNNAVPNYWNPFKSYMAIYLALSSLLNGNDDSSKVLQHGLSACDEFVHGYVSPPVSFFETSWVPLKLALSKARGDITWNGNNAIGIGKQGPVLWQNATTGTGTAPEVDADELQLSDEKFTNISNDLFTKPAWMCRNRTLLKAIEDLANNITISMLSSASLVTQNATTVDMLYFPTQNIYKYDSRNLILSYSIAALFTILCAFAGFFALRYNGVAHSTAFSAIIATTRSHDLDTVSRGHSLGALPLEHTSMKVRFGELMRDGEKTWDGDGNDGEGGPTRHIGFGAATKVLSLKKGGKYT
ncbi:hypothetical protein MMC22_004888 [Lobaria immixta]|nr:hypothetical protein [Lobaria immixta]